MSKRDLQAVGALLFLAAVLAGMLWQVNRVRSRLLRDNADVRTGIAALEAKRPGPTRSLVAETASAAPAPGVKRSPSETVAARILRAHPEMAAVWRRNDRRAMLGVYARALARLKLAPDMLSRLKELMTDQWEAQSDAEQAASEAGMVFNSPPYNQAVEAARAVYDKRIAALMGDAGYADYEKALSTLGKPDPVAAADQYAEQIGDRAAPLSPGQLSSLRQLTDELFDPANPRYSPQAVGPTAGMPDPRTHIPPRDQELIDRAATFLTPSQVGALTESLSAVWRFQALSPRRSAYVP